MTSRASTAILAIAIGAGSIADRVTARPPITLGGYRVLAVDFHVHRSMWSDGALTPWGLVLTPGPDSQPMPLAPGLDWVHTHGCGGGGSGQLAGGASACPPAGELVLPGRAGLRWGGFTPSAEP